MRRSERERAIARTCDDQSKRATRAPTNRNARRVGPTPRVPTESTHTPTRARWRRAREDDATRRARRLEANRAASAASRERKRALERDARRRVDALERLTRALATENAVLKDALLELTCGRRAGGTEGWRRRERAMGTVDADADGADGARGRDGGGVGDVGRGGRRGVAAVVVGSGLYTVAKPD